MKFEIVKAVKRIPQLRRVFFRSALPPWMEEEEAIRFSCSYKPNDSRSEAAGRPNERGKGH